MIPLSDRFELKDTDSGGNVFTRLRTTQCKIYSSEPEATDKSIKPKKYLMYRIESWRG